MNTRVRKQPLGERSEPHPNARSVFVHVEKYLIGCLNGDALDGWRLAFARSGEIGQAMDTFIAELCEMYIREYGLPGKGRHGAPASPERSGGAPA